MKVDYAAPSLAVSPKVSTSVAWYLWSVVAAATLYDIGVYWDIAWHQTIGRDSFLTPAHVCIYLCGVIGGITGAILVFGTTFGKQASLRESSIKVWGLRAPLGAFVISWGGLLMLTAGPFDNWWHLAYGLDAALNSPPHWVLTTGTFAVQLGGIILIAGAINRSSEEVQRLLKWFLLLLGAMIIALPLSLANSRVLQHSAVFYAAVCAAVPVVMLAAATTSGRRWACTGVAAIYTVFVLIFHWTLPFFHGSPGLGPVYRQVTHFVPSTFPMLIIVPALFMDYARARWATRSLWLQSAIYGATFLGVLVAVQWPFADFLMSAYSRNWFFSTQYMPYFIPPTSHLARNVFYLEKSRLSFWLGMTAALCISILGSRIGLAMGNWLRRVRR